MSDKLTPKQRAFVAEYLKDRNATQAAIRAGYSPDGAGQTAHNLLKKTEIAAAVEQREQAVAEKCGITAEFILNGLKQHALESEGLVSMKGYELLGKHLKLFTDKQEVSGPGGGPARLIIEGLDD